LSRRCHRKTGISSFRFISEAATNKTTNEVAKIARFRLGRSCSWMRSSGGRA
jgi:hypothetical protein